MTAATLLAEPITSSYSVLNISSAELKVLTDYFLKAAQGLMRSPSGFLKHPFLVPGGSYQFQLWDWDSYWLNKGLLALRKNASPAFAQEILDCGIGSWLNFFANQAENGAIPILIQPDCADFFGCTVDNDTETNHAKPVFGQFALDLVQAGVSTEIFQPHLSGLRRFHQHWKTKYSAPNGLLTWGSDTAIGVDNDPTTYGRPEFSSANLLLNCLYHADLVAASHLATLCGDSVMATQSMQDATALASAINRECWDERDGFFYTVDVQCEDLRSRYIPAHVPLGMDLHWTSLPLKIRTFTGFLPMMAGVSSAMQNERLVKEHFADPRTFNARFGIRTLSADERMYCPEVESSNPSNWLGPIWIIANFMVWESLRNAGYTNEAAELAYKTQRLLLDDLQHTGTLHECYHPDSGAPNFNAGFISWNVLALLMRP